MSPPTAAQLAAENQALRERLAARNEVRGVPLCLLLCYRGARAQQRTGTDRKRSLLGTQTIGQLNHSVDLLHAKLAVYTDQEGQKPELAGAEQQNEGAEEDDGEAAEGGEGSGAIVEEDMDLDSADDHKTEQPTWSAIDGIWRCARCEWELEGDEGAVNEGVECCGARYVWEWGPEGVSERLQSCG